MAEQPVADPTTPSSVDVAAVARHVEALNLAGLGFATKRLLGKDGRGVTSQFTMWARQDHPALPSITAAYWQAVSPLGIGIPPGRDAALCDKLLRARAGDAQAGAAAATGCAEAGKAAFAASPLPTGTAGADRAHALVTAVKDFWRASGSVTTELRPRVLDGDRDRAARLMGKGQAALEDLVHQIAVLATAVAAQAPSLPATGAGDPVAGDPADGAPVADQAADDLLVHVEGQPTGRLPNSPLGELSQAEDRAVAFARAERVVEEPAAEPAPVEVLSTKPVKDRVLAPVVFAVVVAGLALYVIFSVLNAPNPLAG